VSSALVIILHAHIPYVLGHGAWPHGEDWLNESVAESYIPLLRIFNNLADDGCLPKVTVVVTPILAEQLCDAGFKEQFKGYLKNKLNAAEQDESSFVAQGDMHLARLARMWREYYEQLTRDFIGVHNEDIVAGFRSLEQRGAIEVMTCAATHGYLPLLSEDAAIRAQLRVAVETHKRHFGVAPRGLWLPECAYRPAQEWIYPIEGWGPPKHRPGLEELLAEVGIRYFIVDSHLLQGGEPVPIYHRRFGEPANRVKTEIPTEGRHSHVAMRSPYNVYYAAPERGAAKVAFFTRDPKASLQVWSAAAGYPGDGNYLEFHKKRWPGGHRYWRVTDRNADLGAKLPYVPEEAEERAKEHARHFLTLLLETTRQPGVRVLTAPYDAELYGHWWFEGPHWLERVLRLAHDHSDIEPLTAAEFLETHQPVEAVQLPEGSWGSGGAHGVWFNRDTRWTWVRVYDAEAKMRETVRAASGRADGDLRRLLKQMARELLLLESSDWQFNMTTWSARDYAERRIEEHYSAFRDLYEITCRYLRDGALSARDTDILRKLEEIDRPFQTVEPEWWLSP